VDHLSGHVKCIEFNTNFSTMYDIFNITNANEIIQKNVFSPEKYRVKAANMEYQFLN